MICPRCNSMNVNIQAVSVRKKRGCIATLFWILLAVCTIGAVIWIPLIMRKGSKIKSYAVCQDCGYTWKV